jgi:peptidoglycan/xylan/chitin deacetylase (PgdA/CDA1 family)
MDNELYSYSPIASRPRLEWPGGARIAFFIGLNIEHFHVDRPSTSIEGVTVGLVPDPMNQGWRDYGTRVGIWRMIDLLDRLGLTPSAIVNSEVCDRYPQIIAAGTERDWAWVAHGQTNSTLHTNMSEDAEREVLAGIVETLERATSRRPRGWLGPALTETLATPRLLRELGFTYVLDWCADDQPFALNVDGMISVPYSIEVNDIPLFVGKNLSGPEYERLIADQLEQLLSDAEESGRVMALPLHPFVINQPFRHKYLTRVLERIVATDGVWLTTSDAIAEHYLAARRESDGGNA